MHDALHRRLVELGVPRERHHRAGLSTYFPPEFELYTAHLDETMLAEALVVFVSHGVISLTQGLDAEATAQRACGTHVCTFYRTGPELEELVGAFLRSGVREGQRCVWVLPHWLSDEDVPTALARLGLAEDLAARRLLLFRHTDVYEGADGVIKDPQAILAFWYGLEEESIADGFPALRVTGDVTWIGEEPERWRAFLDYELTLQGVIHPSRLLALCSYMLGPLPEERLTDVLHQHDCGVVHRRGAWDEIRPSPGSLAMLRALAGRPA